MGNANNTTQAKTKPGWESVLATLELFPSLGKRTRTVIRHTLVDDWNLGWEKEYAKLDTIAEPMFIEPKSYVFVGYSRERMNLKNMAKHEQIRAFSKILAKELSYEIAQERTDSRVVLLKRPGSKSKIR